MSKRARTTGRLETRFVGGGSVQWLGLCPCGCGTYRAMLLDDDNEPVGWFGWDREGWVKFTQGIFHMIDGHSHDGPVCAHHTAH